VGFIYNKPLKISVTRGMKDGWREPLQQPLWGRENNTLPPHSNTGSDIFVCITSPVVCGGVRDKVLDTSLLIQSKGYSRYYHNTKITLGAFKNTWQMGT
jgi:hypothetical protein